MTIKQMSCEENAMLMQLVCATQAAMTLCATFHTQEDWQRFYDREHGPLPFARRVFEGYAENVHSMFVGEFLRHLHAAKVNIYTTVDPLPPAVCH
jgi:hypothetical protein